ncbi:calcium-activated potassium channel subunit beta-1 isoform X2 [Sminthopsis crassicaudata]|uniref:calcium-activated potassium channel subunit beta-1 isoform X2 n=1 Tax=Sminthopsis crassicaudata TaxID=9301 RepID=UPI003D687CFD
MGKNLVTAQIRGETRALCLGALMVVCSAITYYILGTTVLPLYHKSVWTKISSCHLIEADIRDHEKLDGKKVPQYPCLWVNVSATGKSAILYHTEETKEKNRQGGPLIAMFCPLNSASWLLRIPSRFRSSPTFCKTSPLPSVFPSEITFQLFLYMLYISGYLHICY